MQQGKHGQLMRVKIPARARAQVWVSPVRPRVIEALLSFTRLEAVRLEAYSSLETACCFSALKHLPALTHLDLRLSGSHYALGDNVEALHSLAKCLRLVRPALSLLHAQLCPSTPLSHDCAWSSALIPCAFVFAGLSSSLLCFDAPLSRQVPAPGPPRSFTLACTALPLHSLVP